MMLSYLLDSFPTSTVAIWYLRRRETLQSKVTTINALSGSSSASVLIELIGGTTR
ncbi:hypothetical protein M378DRAFT_165033 [Amanita muscaria Koide BX008]|uniref:Uncharacterized protein n=1 Tax=Amanita muscaria (strain Koide BX008) TaxID=946122 RepID=A0A0C2X1E8_AMAMK|nr:hypothetical protein M378DRAFT_165033 [Amanita muscaria Koide BX008]